MNSEIEKEIASKLLKDLEIRTGLEVSNFNIDFSNSLGEGSVVWYKGEYLEGSSDIGINDENGKHIGGGWIDYILDEKDNLYAFWTYLDIEVNGKKYSNDTHSIPDNVWLLLSEKTKLHLAKTHQGWNGDEKLLPYRYQVCPKQLLEQYQLCKSNSAVYVEMNLGREQKEALKNLFARVEKYIGSEEFPRKHERDVYEIENYLGYFNNPSGKFNKQIEELNNLEFLLDHCQTLFPKLPLDYYK